MLKIFKALASKDKEPKTKRCNLYILPDNSFIIQGFFMRITVLGLSILTSGRVFQKS